MGSWHIHVCVLLVLLDRLASSAQQELQHSSMTLPGSLVAQEDVAAVIKQLVVPHVRAHAKGTPCSGKKC